jgi:hypothetical protein
MQRHGGGVVAPQILKLGDKCECLASRYGHVNPPTKKSGIRIRGWVGPRTGFYAVGRKIYPAENRILIIGSVA